MPRFYLTRLYSHGKSAFTLAGLGATAPHPDPPCFTFNRTAGSGSPRGVDPRPVPMAVGSPGLHHSCNPLIPRKLRLFSALRCYNRRATRIVLGRTAYVGD